MPSGRLCPACRNTLLSRYNPDPLCAACTRAAQAPPQMDLATALAVFRAASGLSQHQLAEITGWSQSTLSLFESGRRDTLYDIRVWLRFADLVDMPREASLPLVLGRANAVVADDWLADVGAVEETGVDVDRRAFGGVAAGGVVAFMLPEITVPSRVTASHVRYLQACADGLYRRDQAVGGAGLLKQAFRQWQRARRMLDESSYTDTVGNQLLAAAGDLATCAGWLAFDAADVQLARRLYSEALLLAGSAGDTILTAHVLEKCSMLASYVARSGGSRGLAREGLRLANRAAEVARHDPMPRLHALIALRRANAVSILGDEPAFRSAIAHARDELDRGASGDDPQWIRFVSEAEITGHEVRGRAHLGDVDTAAAACRHSLDDPALPPRNRACRRAQLAAMLAKSGNAQGAISEGMAVLPALEGGVASIRTLNELRPVRDAADRAKAEEFCARFDAVDRALTAV